MQISLAISPVAPTPTPGTPPAVPPLLDFPGLVAGSMFDIAKGSKVGFLTPHGTTSIDQIDAQSGVFHIKAGAFGVNVDMLVAVKRLNATQVELLTTKDGATSRAVGDIVATRTNYAEFVSTDGTNEHTVIARDAATGVVTLDAAVPSFGKAHLVLAPHTA